MKRRLTFFASALVFAWDLATDALRTLVRRPRRSRAIVLVYHDVGDRDAGRFAWQAAWLRRHARVRSAGDLLATGFTDDGLLVTFDDAYEGVFRNALPCLQAHDIPCLIFVPVGCLGTPPGWEKRSRPEYPDSRVATLDCLRQHRGPLVDYGSHGVNHLSLTHVSESVARAEIAESKRMLQDALDRPVTTLAFPYGHFAPIHLDWCREAGYRAVFSANPRWVTRPEHGLLVHRTSVSPKNGRLEFILKARGAYRWYGEAARLKQTLRRLRRRPPSPAPTQNPPSVAADVSRG